MAHAQEPEGAKTLLDRLEQSDRVDQVPVGVLNAVAQRHPRRLTESQRERLRKSLRRRPGGKAALSRGKAALSDLSIEESLQQIGGSRWPRQDINFVPDGTAIPAGDVNGDGINDWIYRYSSVADDRTSDLSDRTTKTLLVYGGGDFSARYYDEIYYRDLAPTGNFIGGGNADAYQSTDGGIRIYEGTGQGYRQAGEKLDVPSSPSLVADIDGDGYDDLIASSPTATDITVIYGAEEVSGVTAETFNPSFIGEQSFSYGASDVDGDGAGEIIRVGGQLRRTEDSLTVGVFAQPDSGSALSKAQKFSLNPSAPVSDARFLNVDLADIDGSGTEEILLSGSGILESTLVFTSSSGSYDPTPISYTAGAGDLNPVGDLNGDGRADFVFDDGESTAIGFGSEAVRRGLSSDLTFAEDSEPVSIARSFPKPFGDLTGDGTDNLIAQVSPSEGVGSRLVQVTENGSFDSGTTDILFDRSTYSGDGVMQGVNVGDWDGDGTDDVALLYRDGRAEIYFGDPAQSVSPDVTLTGPRYRSGGGESAGSVAAGDFTGNGDQNLAIAWESASQTVAVYEAGDGDSPVQTISLSDLGIFDRATGIETSDDGPNGVVANLGDINGDGTVDLGVTQPEVETDAARKVFLFCGGPGLSSQPSETIDYTDREDTSDDFGQVLRGVGDVNGDGTDDFLVGDTFSSFSGSEFPVGALGNRRAQGALFVHYGNPGGPQSQDADEILAVPTLEETSGRQRINSAFGFSGIAVGDFNGDGTPDVAAKPGISDFRDSNNGAQAIRIFYGGPEFDGTPDAELPIPGVIDTFSDSEFASNSFGALTALPPASSGGPDRLVQETYNPSNALVYGPGPDTTSSLEKTALLRGPDQRSGLGAGTIFINLPQNASSAVGDFNGNGQVNLVMPQLLSADFRGAPAYAYELGSGSGPEETPVASSTRPVENPAGSSADFDGTGTSIVFSDSTEGSGEVTVERFGSRPEGGGTIGAENVSEYRVEITATGGLSVGDSTEVRFDASMLEGTSDPGQVTIYTRELSGIGGFNQVPTEYDASSEELVGLVSGFSEFAFGSDTEPLFSYPEALSVEASRAFPSASEPGDYRLVALPGQVDTPLAQAFSGEAGADWQAYWDDGSAESPFLRYEESETFDFRPGRGFWVTSRQDWSFSDSLSTVPLGAGQATAVPLNGDSTWTIVSNPLDRDAAWRSVQAENDITAPLWRFDGSEGFVRADTMASAASGEAYYFFNGAGLDSLRVPYPATGTKSRTDSKSAPASAPAAPLALSAAPAGTDDPPSTIHVGLSEQERSALAPPGRFEPASLRIVGSEKGKSSSPRARSYMVKTRPAGTGGGYTFQLRLESQPEEPVRLSTSGLEGRSASLIVPSTGKSYDLRPGRAVEVEPEGGATRLRLAVGTSQYVGEEARSALPEEMSLTSYPNPAGRRATVEYALPEARKVTLEVYDVLGRRVATLADGKKQAGRHEASLQARKLPSGVYFGRLEAGGQTRTQKITVVR
ncbi:T9SS type A sorting domain-containing protein [Salinibacter ruber]|uniref:T9SS type A sorting domain-containing protein n=1 Tax=Salinibacter ruber TaxID=146919 RepID=UPI00130ED066|nr:T9SS type A sorting domain-containing protein [Salinibacter ruber]